MDRLEDRISPEDVANGWYKSEIPDEFRQRHQGPHTVGGCTLSLLRIMREMEARGMACVSRDFSDDSRGYGFCEKLCNRINAVAMRWGFGFVARRKDGCVYIVDKRKL